MLHYCKKCGRIIINFGEDTLLCDCCKSVTFPVPEEYLYEGCCTAFKNEEARKTVIEKLVKTAPEFDQNLFEQRDEILAKKTAELKAKLAEGKAYLEGQNKQVTCPYCSSTRVSRISILGRIVSVEFWGLASSKIGKQWKCHSCGSEF